MTDRLGQLLKEHRRMRNLSQKALAQRLGFTQPYVSKLEQGTNRIISIDERRRIGERLDISPEELGLVDAEGSRDRLLIDPAAEALLKAGSALREHGAAAQANDLVGLLIRELSSRRTQGGPPRAKILARALLIRGVARGDILLPGSTGLALADLREAARIGEQAEDAALSAEVLAKLGNEQRKAGLLGEARSALDHAAEIAPTPRLMAMALIGRARADAERMDRPAFDRTVLELRRITEEPDSWSTVVHPFVVDEVELRGRLLLGGGWQPFLESIGSSNLNSAAANVAPQWHLIAAVTRATMLLRHGELEVAYDVLGDCIQVATRLHLPGQLQRVESLVRPPAGKRAQGRRAALLRKAARERRGELLSANGVPTR